MYLKGFVFTMFVVLVQCGLRLPPTTYPISYDLSIDVTESWKTTNFAGRVEIVIGVAEETNQIILSYDYISISLDFQAKLYRVQDDLLLEIVTKQIELQNMWMQLVIEIEDEGISLEVGERYMVIVNFTTYFDSAAKGVYFQGELFNATESRMVATNFFPNYARQAFPCYDEPAFKASIKLSIVHGNQFNAISNMEVDVQVTDPNLAVTTTIFKSTPALSLHSFGFVVSQLKSETVDKNVKYVAFYDEKHQSGDVDLVLNTEDKILAALEEYLNAELGLFEIKEVPQYDNLYIKIGTYGLVLNDYRYYYCGLTSTLFQREEVIRRTARLMSNQFFSNLISPNAWEDAWITQGLSTLLEYTLLSADFLNLKSFDTLLVKLYSFKGYKRVYYPVDDPNMARYLIDRSHEWKAAEFMFMLQNIVTDKIFQIFLQKLVTDYRNVPLSTDQFLNLLTNVAHENEVLPLNYNFVTILETWLSSMGVPVVAVSRDYATGKVMLVQQNVFDWDSEDLTWWVPYNYLIENTDSDWPTIPNGWIENSLSLELDLSAELNSTQWILFNIKQSGYYHTIYDHQNWLLLAGQLTTDHEKIHYINRGHLVSDAFIFGYEKRVTLDVAFASSNYLNKEESTFAFRILFTDEFYAIDNNLFASDVYKNYTIFMRHQIKNIYKRIRVTRLVEELDFDEISIRNTITKFACRIHLKECLEDANKMFEKYFADPEQIDSQYESDLGYNLIMYGFILSNETVFWDVFNRINDGKSVKTYYTEMIGMTENPVLTKDLVNILVTENDDSYKEITINLDRYVRIIIFETLIKNNYGAIDMFYEVLDERSDKVLQIYGFYASYLIKGLLDRTTTEDRLNKIVAFVPKYVTNLEDYAYAISQARIIVKWNVDRSVEFCDLLANYVEQIQQEEAEEEEKEIEDVDADDSAVFCTSNILTILVVQIIVTFTV